MLTIRVFEERVFELYGQNLVPGTIHLYAGEEAVAVGVCSHLLDDDYIVSTHRGHGHCIAKGARLDRTMAEILGRKDGYCQGKGGSMHIADFSKGMLGATAVVGAGIPIATGAGLSIKLRGTKQVAACFFGDGASNQGTFHEGINLAAIWRLPVLFICENNLYAMGTRQSQAMIVPDIAERARAYGIPGILVKGNDVLEVFKAAKEAVERARGGNGPTLVECKTYRRMGHSRMDPAAYRPRAEVDEWLRNDPIRRSKDELLRMGISDAELAKIEARVSDAVNTAAEFALNSPFPDSKEAFEGVYGQEGT
ncbi:thiamine pyrophosphate-dependent dehydrogenase E1 component subunit alpha [Candidatus Bathyarchaeota archaeon]|nr:thiamine pyrophosphate-dependent dehydrogenase E1 component subunit alpha [Candidatus Bathyarchaeota archaeon]